MRPYLGRRLKEGAIWKAPALSLKEREEGSSALYPMERGWSDETVRLLNLMPLCENPATREEQIGCLDAWLSLLPGGFHYAVPVFGGGGLMLFFGRKGTALQLIGLYSASG